MPQHRHADTGARSEAPQSRVARRAAAVAPVSTTADEDHDDQPPEQEDESSAPELEAPDAEDASGERSGASATTTPGSARSDGQSASATRTFDGERSVMVKPVLASEALMEDLAPLEPSGSAARLWCAALGGGFLLFGAMRIAGVGGGGLFAAAPELVLGGISLVAALMRLTYRQRAISMVVLGLLSAMVGLRGFPGSQGWGPLRTLTAIVLPAALLFRARYRAYARARWILAAAVALSIPYIVVSIQRVTALDVGPAFVGSTIAILAVGTSLLGFMGAETTGGGTFTALAVVIGLAVDLTLQSLGAPGAQLTVTSIASSVASAAVFAGTSAMASLGLFQILAWRFAADARRINIHPEPKETKRKPMPSSDWSTKD